MNLRSFPTLAAALALVPALGLSAHAAPSLGLRPVPAGLRAIDGNAGGRILDGTVSAASSDEAFRLGLRRARDYFGSGLRLAGVVRSKDGTMTLGLFKASLGGSGVGGFLLATYVPHGSSRVDVLFDRVDRVSRTMRGLIARTASLHPAGPASASGAVAADGPAPLHPVTSPDGSVRVLLADGWRPGVFSQGAFAATGPDGAEVDQEVTISLSDPRGPMGLRAPNTIATYSDDVVAAYRSARAAMTQHGAPAAETTFSSVRTLAAPFPGTALDAVEGTNVVNGVTHRFMGQLLVSAPNRYGGWSVTVKMVSAPADRYRRDLPTLVAIYDSYNVDQGVRNGQVAQTLHDNQVAMQRNTQMMADVRARNTAVFNASMDHAQAVQSSIDRSTAGFVHYLNDTTVLEGPGGERGTADSGFARSVVSSDPQNFREVPVSEYDAGD